MKTPAYAERMAQMWLDVARYGDSDGYLNDSTGRLLHPYRDWVISAFSRNVPYDQFVTWQVAGDLLPKATTEQVLADIHQRDGMPVDVPDLRQVGLKFKRVQRLNYHDRPLIQMVYLPERGDPVALCVIEENEGDAPVRASRVGEMKTVTWRTNRLAYVLLAKTPSLDLQAIGDSIASGKTAPLYSSASADVARDS
jgi:hypothetical protein